jgi:hypothetical protein
MTTRPNAWRSATERSAAENNLFLNLKIEDDTGEVGATINRFKYDEFKWIGEEPLNGRDFLFRGNIIEAGRRWFFLDNVLELKNASDGAGERSDSEPAQRVDGDSNSGGCSPGGDREADVSVGMCEGGARLPADELQESSSG